MDAAVPLEPEIERAVTFQSYPVPAVVEGVRIQRLNKHRSDNGWYMEWLRATNGRVEATDGDEWHLRQISVSYAAPRRINAFHLHPRLPQREFWTVIHGELLVWLVDCRADSRTAGAKRSLLLTSEEPAALWIPPGVAHGYKAGGCGALLLYAIDQQFDRRHPNEGRLPWDYFGQELWQEDRG